MHRRKQSYFWVLFLIITGLIMYIVSVDLEGLPISKGHSWYYHEPEYAMSSSDSELYFENIQLIQKEGWKLLMQDNVVVSFNSNLSGRNEIVEDAAMALLQGGYVLNINEDGELESVELSEAAEEKFVTELP